MKVIAKTIGYYQHRRRREGEVFELKPVNGLIPDPKNKGSYLMDEKTGKHKLKVYSPEDQFSSRWMEKFEDAPAPERRSKFKPEPEVDEDSTGNQEVI